MRKNDPRIATMGTDSLIRFVKRAKSGKIVTYVSVYRCWDGYISGVGLELAQWLSQFKTFQGVQIEPTLEEMQARYTNGYYELSLAERHPMGIAANGISDLAVQYIAKFKTHAGGLDLAQEDDGAEYEYTIIWDVKQKDIRVVAEYHDNETQELSISQFLLFCEGVKEREKAKNKDAEVCNTFLKRKPVGDSSDEDVPIVKSAKIEKQ